jgi:hypothetical protein
VTVERTGGRADESRRSSRLEIPSPARNARPTSAGTEWEPLRELSGDYLGTGVVHGWAVLLLLPYAPREVATDLIGNWRIVEMDLWDLDAIELLGPSLLSVGGDGIGRFRVIAVEGHIDWKAEEGPDSAVNFTWEGTDDGDPVSGRGWMRIDDDGSLRGRIYFHLGDNSGFRAVRTI